MDQNQIHEAVAKAIHFSDSLDKRVAGDPNRSKGERRWFRLNAVVTSLGMALDEHAPGVFDELRGLMDRVVMNENPQRDEVGSNKEKPQ